MFKLNLIQKLKKQFFPFYKNKEIKIVFKKLQENSSDKSEIAMFVGGCVRKYLTGKKIDDIDIATILTTDQIKEKFENTKFRIIDSGIKHGTVTLISEKLKLEITTLRKDKETDGRHAKIEYTNNWQEDSNRRDFTINAIYLNSNGKIFDPQSGMSDLKNNNVKFIGDPNKRINEDYLRIIRFIRFSIEYKCKPEKTTIDSIKVNLDGIKNISKERILIELFKIIKSENFYQIVNDIELKKIFLLIFPEFENLNRLIRLSEIKIDKISNRDLILAILLIDEKNNQEYFCHKYNVSNELKKKLNLFSSNYFKFKNDKNFFEKDLKKNIFQFGKEHLSELNTLNFLENKKNNKAKYLRIHKEIYHSSIPKFPFDGSYLKKKGIKEGEVIGKILGSLKNEWLNNNFKITDQKVIQIIKKYEV